MVNVSLAIKHALKALVYPWPLLQFLLNPAGQEYGIGLGRKIRLIIQVWWNSSLSGSASSFFEQLRIVQGVLAVPKDIIGAVAEFGCYKGAATASLSLACALTNRRLLIFDSFRGLPEPEEAVTNLVGGAMLPYKAGDYCGTLDEVRQTVTQYGDIRVCEFIEGFFDQTLPQRDPSERYVLIFEDADLPSSVRSVLQWAWPKLRAGQTFFCHEAADKEVVELFFDDGWWKERVGCRAPGFVGSGLGLPLGPSGSCLGYIVKASDQPLQAAPV